MKSIPIPVVITLYVVFVWVAVNFLISWIGGWFELSRTYRATQEFNGQIWRFQDVYLRLLTRYHGAVSVGASQEGLYLSVIFLVRPGHPPLFIPWQDISVKPGKVLWVRVYQFQFRQVPSVRLRLKEKLVKDIQAAAGASWPGDRAATGAAF
jgi:hypothetical protein